MILDLNDKPTFVISENYIIMSKEPFKMSGRIVAIQPAKQVTEKFITRDFTIAIKEDTDWPEYVTFQAMNQRAGDLDNFKENDVVRINFDVSGRKWTSPEGVVKYFNTLKAWGVKSEEKEPDARSHPNKEENLEMSSKDDLPF